MIGHETDPTAIAARAGVSARLAGLVGCAPGRVVFVGRDCRATTSTSWDALLRRGARLSAGLESAGCPPGSPVAIQGTTSPGVVAAILGMLVGGRPFVVLPPLGSSGPSERRDRTLARCGVAAIVVDGAGRSGFGAGANGTLPVFVADELVDRGPAGAEPTPADPDAVAIFQPSSGTMGDPKALGITGGAVAANLAAIRSRLAATPGDRFVSWLPLYHDMGLVGTLLLSVTAGLDAVYIPTEAYVHQPRLWLRTASAFRATLLCAPNSGYRMAARLLDTEARLDLTTVRAALCGAELVRPDDMRRWLGAAARFGLAPQAASPCYGLAEATLAVSILSPGRGLRTSGGDVSCGTPVDGVDVAIGDPRQPARDGEPGEVFVRSAAMFATVVDDGGPVPAELLLEDGWLATGDVGYLRDGELHLRGRLKELINVGGRNVMPQDVEASAELADGVRPGRVVAFGVDVHTDGREAAVVLVEPRPTHDDRVTALAADVRRRVQQSCGVAVRDVVVLERGSIEKTTSGKLRRRAMRDRYLLGAHR